MGALRDQTVVNIREWGGRRKRKPLKRVGNALSTLLHVPELAEGIARFVRFLREPLLRLLPIVLSYIDDYRLNGLKC